MFLLEVGRYCFPVESSQCLNQFEHYHLSDYFKFVGHRKLPTLQKQQQLAAAVACSSNFTGDSCLHQLQQLPGSSHLGLQPHSLLSSNTSSVSGDLLNVASSVSSCNAWTQMPTNNHNASMYVQFHQQQQQQLKNNKIVNKQTLQMPQVVE